MTTDPALRALLANTRSHAVAMTDYRDGTFTECVDANALRAALAAAEAAPLDESGDKRHGHFGQGGWCELCLAHGAAEAAPLDVDDERLAVALHEANIAGVDDYPSWVAYARDILRVLAALRSPR